MIDTNVKQQVEIINEAVDECIQNGISHALCWKKLGRDCFKNWIN